MKVVLFCGGLGMRMREGADSAPKPMVKIGDRPLLWHVMRYYAHFGHTEFILCLGYGASVVKEFFLRYDETLSNDFTLQFAPSSGFATPRRPLSSGGRDLQLHSTDITDWKITFIDTGLNSTVGERLLRIRPYVEDEAVFLANYADTLTNAPLPELIDRFVATDAAVNLLAVPPFSTHHILDFDETGLVRRVRQAHEAMQWENGGFFVMRPTVFDALREGEDMVPHAFDRLLAQRKLMAYPFTGFWRAADTFKDRAELEEMYRRGNCPWMLWDPQRCVEAARA